MTARRATAFGRRLLACLPLAALAAPLTAVTPVRAALPEGGVIIGVAGDGSDGFSGDGGPATAASLSAPAAVAVGPDGSLYIADTANHRVRRVHPDATITTVVGTGVPGYAGDGGPATKAQIDAPEAVLVDSGGVLYVADTESSAVRRVGRDGVITTVAGTGSTRYAGDGGPATSARLNEPRGLALGPDGALYIADSFNHRVRRVGPDGIIDTVVGRGVYGSAGDGGPALEAELGHPRGLAFDASGNLYIADSLEHRIRRVDSAGRISTVAGTGLAGYDGDGHPAAGSRLSDPRSVAVDAAGTLFVADTDNHRIRMITLDGTIHTAAGFGSTSFDGGEGDGQLAIHAPLKLPKGIAVDASGALYIADTGHDRIRRVADPEAAPPGPPVAEARPAGETEPVGGSGDAADDPAVWLHPTEPARSLVIGTDKAADTLEVWDLEGRHLQRLADANGSVNAVDVRTGVTMGDAVVDLVVSGGSDMAVYRMDPESRRLTDVTARLIDPVHSAHGLCLYHSRRSGRLYAFALDSNGMVEQFELIATAGGLIDARSVRGPWDAGPLDGGSVLDGEIEACVTDDETASLYLAEQDAAVWRYGAEPDQPTHAGSRAMVGATASFAGGPLYPDIEGVAVVPTPGGARYLIASSQGDDTYSVFQAEAPYAFVRKLRVADGPAADGCTRTDGIEAVSADLGPVFPHGVFICQDHVNTSAGGNLRQNFKLVPLEQVLPVEPGPGDPGPEPQPGPEPGPGPAPGSGSGTGGGTPGDVSGPRPAPPADPAVKAGSPGSPPRVGYWMLGSAGEVFAFGDAADHGSATGAGSPEWEAVDLEPTPSGDGYWILDRSGRTQRFGDASPLGALPPGTLRAGEAATSLSVTPAGKGAWIFTSLGRVFSLGDAVHRGDMAGSVLNGPVLDSIATPTGLGYYMVASDGGLFAFGDARFFGSMGGRPLNAPVESLVPDPDGTGYWLVASDGGVFAFQAPFRGSMGGVPLNAAVTGMVPFGSGYLMVGRDGGIFNFSGLPFLGSLGASPPADPIAAVAILFR